MLRVAEAVQHIAHPVVLQFYAASKTADSALLTIQTVLAVLYVIMVLEPADAVQKHTVATLTSAADLAVQHSGHVIVTAHAQHKDT